ncbi:Uncharacterised protein [uncultured archaeon]|nr:Uncharacterised protein [uncultured archaeon]
MDTYPLLRKCLVVGIILLFLGGSTTFGVNASCITPQLPRVVHQHVQAIQQDVVGQPCLVGNVKVSPGAGNDYHPRMTTNGLGYPIVVYEQEIDENRKQIPVVYSTDDGQTWTMKFLFDSINFSSGSGMLQYPDIVYNAPNDLLFLTMIDPKADVYNSGMSFIPGDIAHAENATWYGTSTCLSNYTDGGAGCTNNFFIALATADDCAYTLRQVFQLCWVTYPDFKYPPGTSGFNVDGNTLFQSAPASEIEMDSNLNQIFLVCETNLDSGTKITMKTNVMNEELITSGEMQHNMEKYVDPEQMPGEYLGLGTDPDVSGSGNKVCVVYVEDGNVICKSSTTSAVYNPGFNWHTSRVDTNASAPAVYMQGNNVYCAYVKDRDLYLKVSEDGGITWGAAEQKNDVKGTVVAAKGTVDICSRGIAFTDTRNGNYDIYYASYVTRPTPELSITGLIPLKMTIKNIGDAPANNVSWNITVTVKKGFIFPGKFLSGIVIGSLEPGQEITVGRKQLLLGFGSIEILGAAWAENAPLVSEKLTGRLLLFFFVP